MSDDPRLDRIEGKLDKLAEAVVAMARMEERLLTLFTRMQKYDESQDRIASRVYDIEKKVESRSPFFAILDKLVWILISGGVATAYWFLRTPS